MGYIIAYLAAIVAANLSVAHFGPASMPINAFLLIGFDLTARDGLHEAWREDGLFWKMAALIAAGSGLSWALNAAAGPIALASLVAFAAAGVTDWLVYSRLVDETQLVRMNGSNLASAAVDSVVFPTLAFGALMPGVVLAQYVAKVGGGAMWAWLLTRVRA